MLCGSTWLSLLFLFFCSWHLLFWQDSFLQRSQVVICQCPGNQILVWSEFAGWVYFFWPFISVATRQTFKPNCYPFSMYNKVWAFLSVDCLGLALTKGFVDTCSDGDKFPLLCHCKYKLFFFFFPNQTKHHFIKVNSQGSFCPQLQQFCTSMIKLLNISRLQMAGDIFARESCLDLCTA